MSGAVTNVVYRSLSTTVISCRAREMYVSLIHPDRLATVPSTTMRVCPAASVSGTPFSPCESNQARTLLFGVH